ncbi:MAG TPA: phosphoenolpyruvate--protein phosphotransferase [Usitatibacter sp.]|nr:phosphoenolpyruvate--protein phosphotransferase [Usitatibacter sp.]
MKVAAPFAGWCLPLAEVPDPVFAGAMAGDGVAIDPLEGALRAPCDGEVVPMQGAKHAVTLRTAEGIEVLVHVGIETVALKGDGFEMLVAPGDRVREGDVLLTFDMDRVARGATSLVTPVIVASGGRVVTRAAAGMVKAGDFLMQVEAERAVAAASASRAEASRRMRVPFDHGLHVRPAAQIAAALRPFVAEVTIHARGRGGNARSTVALMSLGVRCGETVEVRGVGADAAQALAALEALLAPELPAVVRAEAKPAPTVDARRLEGVVASRGVAVGTAVRLAEEEIPIEEHAANAALDATRLQRAVDAVKAHLEKLAQSASGQSLELLRAHAELVQDPELLRRALESVARGKSAAYGWREATRALSDSLAALEDARMRERAADLRDLANQVIRVLKGESPSSGRELPENAIAIAADLLPSQLISMDARRLAGVALARGGATSHVSILAAARGIPMLVAAGPAVLEVADGTTVVLDTEHGWIDIDPPAPELAAARQAAGQRAAERAADLEAAQRPALTLDGVRVVVNANLGTAEEAREALASGAEGCGLLRTEFLFLDRREPPSQSEQAAEYGRIAAALEGKPVSVRTMDVGGDKPIAYLPMPREENPALGMRGVRASLAEPALLRAQLAAILSVRPESQCRVLLPMVNDLEELRTVRAIAAECAREQGRALPAIGVMIETPAAAVLADQLAAEADFLSIGTNDLSQYVLAIDRGHAELAGKLDALHPAVLRMIRAVAVAGAAQGKGVSVCGAMGSDVDALPLLIGLGVHEVSATIASIPRLKRMVRLLEAVQCRELAERALAAPSAAAVRDLARLARSRARGVARSQGVME